ncbi:hypothetical protein ACPPVU_06680 [Mucilaginibacter sp. McL0603]|uniref:hypothetical protein n=1 Tax=Mucilaginibacter sp. McL0603 TaxID=3415670 RepID=UPI003CF92C8D
MKATFQFLKKYPASIICYLFYSWLCYRTLKFNLEFQQRILQNPGKSSMQLGGEVMGYMFVFLLLTAGIFIFISFANAIARKQNAFYLWLSAIIIVQTIVIVKVMK